MRRVAHWSKLGAEALVLGGKQHVVEAGFLDQDPAFLERARNSEPRALMHAQRLDWPAFEPDGAAVGHLPAADDVEQRRLAGAVGPDQAVDAGQRDRQSHVVEGDNAAERLAQARGLKKAVMRSSRGAEATPQRGDTGYAARRIQGERTRMTPKIT